MMFRSRAAVAALALWLAAGPAFAAPAPAPVTTAKKAVHHSAHKVSTATHKAVKKVKATTSAEPAAGSPGPGKQ